MWECKHRLYSVCHLGNLKAPSVVHDKVEFFFGKLGHSTPTVSEILRAQMMLALCTLLSPLRSGGLTVEEKHTNTPEAETSQAFRRRNKNKQHGCKIWAPEDYSYQWSHII